MLVEEKEKGVKRKKKRKRKKLERRTSMMREGRQRWRRAGGTKTTSNTCEHRAKSGRKDSVSREGTHRQSQLKQTIDLVLARAAAVSGPNR
jgi:hypothetical protein